MLKFPCLVLDHDDTVVQSEATIHYPYFCYILDQLRPGVTISYQEYLDGCFYTGFVEMCRQKYSFTPEEIQAEFRGWSEYIQTHIPDSFPDFHKILRKQKECGGILCVVSHSTKDIIERDYLHHFDMLPDEIFGAELPEYQCKPNPYPLEQIMEKYKISSSDILVVDDLKPGWEMARSVGASVAFAKWGKLGNPAICEEMTQLCDYTFDTVNSLEEFLFSV